MASATSHNVNDVDDEFDWEAAVREIDVACLATKPSNSDPINLLHQAPTKPLPETSFPSSINKKHVGSRQSTLDKFIGKSVSPVKLEENEGLRGVQIDVEAAKTWIYPVNVPLRDYQLSMTRTALFSNTLVALPTGLGKTLIAAVVMYNYFRWFPEGKIIFAAPSRPLVMQQIEACHNIVGIPQDWTIDMTGQISPTQRVRLWKAKRVFFVTPQVLENDIRSGTCLVKHLVCLVIDEAHRASGNHSYCVAVRELMDVPVQLRILALTATPGSKQQTIQQVIDNLQISTLEYRNESDPDVSPYVHDRKIELIEVAMGQDAIEINNMLFEVARPFVARLLALGVLPNRDFKTLSPCDFLNARDRFRQAPPVELPPSKCGEVEGFLGVLITLYHIVKLLSSHGIRPAYEMLVEKLQQGPFSRLMSRNEGLWKAKLSMQQSLLHGAPNPKLSKMLEVLIEHFKAKDPPNSRVIIFSNFRGSVRDIMDALMNLGELVKAAQFIGQSSGKALKGQSQKAQQAVLKKFRAGGYNVIVATSIGEEGLDIMEVDLVICFDANISPLRMIQRMGRTGRKHAGRVVVLACEGSELKGYKRKQANGNTIKKHLRNGGMNSFNFHSSPRMVPHIFRPEVKLVELSIEQFVPRGSKVKDDHPSETPTFKAKLTDAESNLLAKYFHPAKENDAWRPSLIAFPHFLAFPSRVSKVMHSLRTGMLIDAMQSLQGLSFTRDRKAFTTEDDDISSVGLGVKSACCQENYIAESLICHNSAEESTLKEVSDSDPLFMETSATEEMHILPDCRGQNFAIHSCQFGPDFISVDSLGREAVLSVPLLPLKEVSNFPKCRSVSNTVLVNCLKQDPFHINSSCGDNNEATRMKEISDSSGSSQPRHIETSNTLTSKLCNPDAQQEKSPLELLSDDSSNDLKDVELSPRLSNFIKSGVVPESPDYAGTPSRKGRGSSIVPELGRSNIEVSPRPSIPMQKDKLESGMHLIASARDVPTSSVNDEIRTPILNIKCNSIIEEVQAPLEDSISNSCSRNWYLSSQGKSESVLKQKKFRRLRKYGDQQKCRPPQCDRENIGPKINLARGCARSTPVFVENGIGKREPVKDARAFIEEEAEVSSEAEVSDDEEDDQENSSYEDSFIDDRINPTAASTQADTNARDMMAIYRRSLLSQSPVERHSNGYYTPNSVAPNSRTSDSASPSGMINDSLDTPHSGSESAVRNSASFQLEPGAITCRESKIHKDSEDDLGKRKRKLSFYQVPAINLDKHFSSQSQAVGTEISPCDQVDRLPTIVERGVVFDDDDKFYEGLDLDAVEEQAAKLLEHKSELSAPKRMIISEPNTPQIGFKGSPSFDLGI